MVVLFWEGAAFLAAARFALASSDRFCAQYFLVAAIIRFMPSVLMRRLGRSGEISEPALIAAHLFFCANAM